MYLIRARAPDDEDPIGIAQILLLLLQNELHFWGPKHARILMKLCTQVSGENVYLIWFSKVGVAKWLDSATYKISMKCL